MDPPPSPPPPRFEHQALDDPEKQQIRLVKVVSSSSPSSSSGNTAVELSIQICELARAPSYVALSYTWGPYKKDHVEGPPLDILIDGRLFSISENLGEFFGSYALLDPCDGEQRRGGLVVGGVEWLWIDQICIDQTRADERNHQVRMMSEIYQGSHLVVAWLGPHDEASLEVALATRSSGTGDAGSSSGSQLWEIRSSAFFGRSYWSRLWIIQELVLGRQTVFMAGAWVFSLLDPPWTDVGGLVYHDTAFGVGSYLSVWAMEFLDRICRLRGSRPDNLWMMIYTVHGPTSLPQIGWGCTNVHDKIYGLMGLVSAHKRLDVDYTMSTRDLCVYLLTEGLQSEDDMRMIFNEDERLQTETQGWSNFAEVFLGGLGKALNLSIEDKIQVEKLFASVWDEKKKEMKMVSKKELGKTKRLLSSRLGRRLESLWHR